MRKWRYWTDVISFRGKVLAFMGNSTHNKLVRITSYDDTQFNGVLGKYLVRFVFLSSVGILSVDVDVCQDWGSLLLYC